ncbi:MAG: hypothetical protein GY769_02145 [bacterium]|nr:hypothetical protein [bacterium]
MRNDDSVRGLIAVAVSVALAASAVAPGLSCAGAARESPAESQADEGTGAQEAEGKASAAMKRDEVYRRALTDFERLAKAREQQPADVEALLAIASDLRGVIDQLREASEGESPVQTTRHETGAGTAAPAGRGTPSAEPTSAEDAEARRRATDQFLSVPVPEAGAHPPTLAHVSDERVREACREAGDELACLETHWRAGGDDTDAVQACISSLETILRGMSRPSERR